MGDLFDDADFGDDGGESFTPEQVVRLGLDAYRAAKSRKLKDDRLRAQLLRGAESQLRRGLADSQSTGPPLSIELADEARRAIEAIPSQLRELKRSNDPRTPGGLQKRLDRLLKKKPPTKPKK